MHDQLDHSHGLAVRGCGKPACTAAHMALYNVLTWGCTMCVMQIAAMLGPGNQVRAYDRRVPRNPPKFRKASTLGEVARPWWADLPMNGIVMALAVLAGAISLCWMVQSQTLNP